MTNKNVGCYTFKNCTKNHESANIRNVPDFMTARVYDTSVIVKVDVVWFQR